MAQELCPVCKGFGKVHPVIYPTSPPEPHKHEYLNPKSETNSNVQNSNGSTALTTSVQNGEPGTECRPSPPDPSVARRSLQDDRRRMGGKVDWSSLIFCICQGDKALKVAHPAVPHPDIVSDIKCERFYDEFDADRQARYRKSPEFRRELMELFGQNETPDSPGNVSEEIHRERTELLKMMNNLQREINILKERLDRPTARKGKPDWRERI